MNANVSLSAQHLGLEYLLGILFIISGMICFLVRNKQEFARYGIGFKIGYTLQSEEAWRQGNTASGIALVISGIIMLVAAKLHISFESFVIVMLTLVAVSIVFGTLKAKKALEIESLRMDGNVEKTLEKYSLKPWTSLMLLLLLVYLAFVAYVYPKLPMVIAVHFGANLKPNAYGLKTPEFFAFPVAIVALFMLILAACKEVLSKKYFKVVAELLITSELLVVVSYFLIIAYNMGINVIWLWVVFFAFLAITLALAFKLVIMRYRKEWVL